MTFDTGPVIHMDELPEHIATLIFGEPLVQKFYRKAFNKPGGHYEIVEIDRNTKTVTVTFSRA